MCKWLLIVLWGISSAIWAEEANLLPDAKLTNPQQWQNARGFRLAPGEGYQGAAALIYERTDPHDYTLVGPTLKLTPGTYEFGGWAYCEITNNEALTAKLCVEIYGKKEYIGGGYDAMVSGPGDWRYMCGTVIVPNRQDIAVIRFTPYMPKGQTGRVKFSNMFVQRQQPKLFCAIAEPRMPHAIPSGKTELTVAFQTFNLPSTSSSKQLRLQLEVRNQENDVAARQQASLDGNTIKLKIDNLKAGEYRLRGAIVDAAQKIIAREEIPFTVIEKKESATVTIDAKGRMIVNGRKFFPIGIYLNWKTSGKCLTLEQELDYLGQSKFNCVLAYDWIEYHAAGSQKQGMDAKREIFDAVQRRGLKIIPSLDYIRESKNRVWEFVRALSAHPAILAWYIYDEQPIKERAEMLTHNALVNRADPNHPTLGVFCWPLTAFQHVGTANIIAHDNYPIYHKTDSIVPLDRAIAGCREALRQGNNPSFWFVPQWMNWLTYNVNTPPETAAKLYRWPTPDEAQAMALLSVTHGAKGILFYSFFDQFKPKNEFAARWPEICKVAAELSELAPYILGDAEPNPPKPLRENGAVRLKMLRDDDGREALIVVALGPGKTQVELSLPGQWISRRGKTVRQPSGSYLFAADKINCDILYRQDK